MKLPRGLPPVLAIGLLFGWAPPASAHIMNTGLGPFSDGLAHLFLTPEDLLPVLALALLAGLRGPSYGRAVLFVLPAAWLLGVLAGRIAGPRSPSAVVPAALTVVIGVLVAADRRLSRSTVVALAVLLGLLHGVLGGMELARARAGVAGNSLGIATAVFVVVAVLAALVSSVRAPWARIVARVAGSWIAAAGLFMLGWTLRGA
jgi:hydrogenase/urease accessory protein HupE